ncbi:sugar-binding transcriptional regulator [Actinomyces mediterranea]|uniref:sugar-binding transcriptional regulator n=1 Tax=Actinomyces mediterranea TaxID=1871028 RepID=UPI000971219B|nr:sugar-binding domain-containing protein [Actinomyces mediterranea]
MEGARESQVLRAAQLYYYENLTQGAIADRMGCTRWTVGRLLEEARKSGIVRITITHPQARVRPLEKQLAAAFGIDTIIVMSSQESDAATGALVAASAADYITSLRPRPSSMGIAWGRTLTAIARAMPDRWTLSLDIYQMYGGLVRSNDDEVADSIGLMARKGRGIGHTLPAPAIVTDSELGRRLRHEPSVARSLAAGPRSDLLLFSPGILEPNSVLVRSGYLTENGLKRLRSMGAVTDVFSHFVDINGEPVSAELEARTIAVPLDAIRAAKRCVAIGWGGAKALPLYASLRGRIAKGLIIDEEAALVILAEHGKRSEDR